METILADYNNLFLNNSDIIAQVLSMVVHLLSPALGKAHKSSQLWLLTDTETDNELHADESVAIHRDLASNNMVLSDVQPAMEARCMSPAVSHKKLKLCGSTNVRCGPVHVFATVGITFVML